MVVTHGFAGSVQLMQAISRDLAQAGYTVAAFDFFGHGRNPELLSSDVTRIEGTTAQLVSQTRAMVHAAKDATGLDGPMAILGHSMASDIIIRAAQDLDDVAAIVAISMYSDAVTAGYPERLLVISGEWEGRLREVGMRAVHQVDPAASEGETATNGNITRRAIYAPRTEHASVLFSTVTKGEIRAWLDKALAHESQGAPRLQGFWALGALAALTALAFPLSRLLGPPVAAPSPLRARQFIGVLAASALAGGLGLWLMPGTLLGLAAFGHLLGFLAAWGLAGLGLLWRFGRRPMLPAPRAVALYLFIGIAFALALDRYMAAFVPSGPRAGLMAALLLGTLPFVLADRLLALGAPIWQRVLYRIAPLVVLSLAMAQIPAQVGLMFTVLPVLVLFYAVYGTMAHAIAARSEATAAGIGAGVMLAWAIAASTPIFAG